MAAAERVERVAFALALAALTVAAVSEALAHPGHVPGEGVDLYGTLWFFDFARRCALGGLDPSWTDAFYYPSGKNIFAHTGNNLVDAVLSVPLQALLPGRTWYTAWVGFVVLSNAVAFRWLTKREVADATAGRLATLLFAINPYVLIELSGGRPTQAWLPFVIVALGMVPRVDEGGRAVVTTGVAVALTGWTYWFYGYFFAVAAVWLAAVALWERPPAARGRYVAHLAASAGVAALLVGPAIWHMRSLRGSAELLGVSKLSAARSVFQLPFRLAESVGVTPQNYTILELDGSRFLQGPAWVLALALGLAWAPGRRRWSGVLVAGLWVAAGLSVVLYGATWRNLPYVVAFHTVPFLERLWFPYRALALVFVAASILAGGALIAVRTRAAARFGEVVGRRLQIGLGLGLVGLSLGTSWSDYSFPLASEDVRVPEVYGWMARHPGGIVELPIGAASRAVRDQAVHGMPLYGGMAENAEVFYPKGFALHRQNTFFRALTQATRVPESLPGVRYADRLAAFKEGFRWVVLNLDLVGAAPPAAVLGAVTHVLGAPIAADGPRVVWALDPGVPPPPASLAPTDLVARAAIRSPPSRVEQHLRAQGRIK